jgi:hypothetical protein
MQPNRAAASFVPGQRSKFSNPSDLRGLSLTAGVFSSPHQRFAPDSSQQLSSFSAVIKTPLGEHRSGVIMARTRKGGSPFHRADLRHPAIKTDGPSVRFALWNQKKLPGSSSGHVRPRWDRAGLKLIDSEPPLGYRRVPQYSGAP